MLSPSASNIPSSAPSSGETAQRRTLLIVDDEEGPRQSLWAIFCNEYEILLADAGKAAVELAKNNKVDVAVLDIRMPGMTGTELLEQLKKIDPRIEIIMLTAYQTVETARQAIHFGACEYLTKPFDITSMSRAVANAMERRAMSDEVQTNMALLKNLQDQISHEKLQNELARSHQQIYASVLHDINNPLTIVNGLIDLMSMQVTKATSNGNIDLSRMQAQLAQTNRQLRNCIAISQRYLGFLRPRNDQHGVAHVNQALQDVRDLLLHHPRLGKNKLDIQPLDQEAVAAIHGLDLIQIILNLAVNALQCTADEHRVEISARVLPNGVEMPAEGETLRFVSEPSFDASAPMLELTVRDDGPGISRANIPNLFEPYFTTRLAESGNGLGLSIVKRLVTGAKGAISVESLEGQGATFRTYFQLAQRK